MSATFNSRDWLDLFQEYMGDDCDTGIHLHRWLGNITSETGMEYSTIWYQTEQTEDNSSYKAIVIFNSSRECQTIIQCDDDIQKILEWLDGKEFDLWEKNKLFGFDGLSKYLPSHIATLIGFQN